MTVYKLLATEKDVNMAQMMPSVTLCTFYKSGETGETTEAEDQAASLVQAATIANLKLKMSEILEKNDWLMGRIKKEPEAAEIFLEVEKTSTDQCDPNNYIKTVESDDIFAHKTMSEIREHLAPFQIGVGATLIGVEEGKLASFGLIEGADSKNLCVFISVSHLIADGGTVYQLYKMLDEGEQVVSLDRKSVEFMDYRMVLGKQTILGSKRSFQLISAIKITHPYDFSSFSRHFPKLFCTLKTRPAC